MEFKNCQNCRKQIPVDRFDLHEAYCLRRNKYCESCRDTYDVADEPDHANSHSKISCPKCGDEYELRARHDPSTCVSHTAQCSYCLNALPLRQLATHEAHCGSRTQRCERCSKSILMSEMPFHIALCVEKQPINLEAIQEKKEIHASNHKQKVQTRRTKPARKAKGDTHFDPVSIDSDEGEDLYQVPKAKKIKKPEPPKKTRPKRAPASHQEPEMAVDEDNDEQFLRALARSFQQQ